MLPRFRRVHRNPLAAGVKFRPTMIAGDFSSALRAEGKANRKARRNAPRPRNRDEQRMEVCAVPFLDVTCVDGIAASPPLAALVVDQIRDNVVIDGARLF